jgi:hypothetical protein
MNPTTRARALRQSMPEAQRRMWRLLRDRRFAGYKFRREHPLGRYTLDFYCARSNWMAGSTDSRSNNGGTKPRRSICSREAS